MTLDKFKDFLKIYKEWKIKYIILLKKLKQLKEKFDKINKF